MHEPESAIDVRAEIHRAGEDKGGLFERRLLAKRGVVAHRNAVGDDQRLHFGHQGANGTGICVRNGNDQVGPPADPGLVAPQPSPLQEGISCSEPAARVFKIGRERALLQKVLTIMFVQYDARRPIDIPQNIEVGGHLQSLYKHPIEGPIGEPGGQTLPEG